MDLMEELKQATGCRYLSDLRYIVIDQEQEKLVRQCLENDFDEEQLANTLVYLGGELPLGSTIQEVKEQIVACLKSEC